MGLRSLFGLAERAAVSSTVLSATDGRDILLNTPDGWEVERPWLWWAGPAGGDGTSGPWGNPPPGADDPAGVASLPAVTRCTSIICDTIAGLPWHIYRGFEQLDTPSWISDPQGLRLDGRIVGGALDTEVRLSAVEFWTDWLVSALWFGDGFVWVGARGADGQPKAGTLKILNPQRVTVRDGRYLIGDELMAPGEIIHLRGEGPYRGGRGVGVLQRHGLDLQLAASTRSFAGNAYTSGVPAGYLKVNAPQLTQEQATTLKAQWMAQHGGTRRSIAVLNATTEFHPIALSPIDAQLDRSREWSLRDVALAFGVPPYMLGIPGDSSTYANVESRMIELRTFTLLPWIRRVESTLDAQFPRGTEVKVITEGALRADTKTRYDAYASALEHKWLTVDEVRALEDRPPLPEQVGTDPTAGSLPPLPPLQEPAPQLTELPVAQEVSP